MVKKFLVLSLALFLLGSGLDILGQEEDVEPPGRHYVINFSLYYPISLNKTKNDSVNFNLGLIYTHVGTIRGVDITGFASAASRRLEGIQVCGFLAVAGESGVGGQFSGFLNAAGESFSGIQLSGFMNVVGEDGSVFQSSGFMNVVGQKGNGFQAAGLANIVGEDFNGAQCSGLFSVIGQDANAFQAAGLFNVIGERAAGVQTAGIFNVTGENFYGVQAAGLFNVSGGIFRGLQTSVFNIAAESEGLQVGAANIAGTCRGVQVGVVNYTKDDNHGLPFGLVNLARNGRIGAVIWGGGSVAVTAGIKFRVNRIYSLLSLGTINLQDGIGKSLTYGFHYGYTFPLRNVDLNADLGYRYRDNTSLFKHSDLKPDQHMIEARLLADIPLSRRISLIAGGGLRLVDTTGDGSGFNSLYPLFAAGLELH